MSRKQPNSDGQILIDSTPMMVSRPMEFRNMLPRLNDLTDS